MEFEFNDTLDEVVKTIFDSDKGEAIEKLKEAWEKFAVELKTYGERKIGDEALTLGQLICNELSPGELHLLLLGFQGAFSTLLKKLIKDFDETSSTDIMQEMIYFISYASVVAEHRYMAKHAKCRDKYDQVKEEIDRLAEEKK